MTLDETTCAMSMSPWSRTSAPGEQKTKPTQHSVTDLRSRAVQPDVIILRSDRPIPASLKTKISPLCDVPEEGVISNVDAPDLYEIPRPSTTRAWTTMCAIYCE